MTNIMLFLWLILILGMLFYLFKKYIYNNLFNEENITKLKIEAQKQKEHLAKKELAIELKESNKIVKKFNWGAFLIPVIWGVCYNTWKELIICLIPIPFYSNLIFGLKGNKWALSRYYNTLEKYNLEQKLFIIIGIIVNVTLVSLVLSKIN